MLCYIFCSCLRRFRERKKKEDEGRQTKKMETGLMDGKRQNLQLERESEGPTAGSSGSQRGGF